jgi:hypothetical protein
MTESERTPATAPEKDPLRPGCSDSAVESGSFHIPLSCSVQALWSAPSAFEQCTEIALAALSSAASVFHPSSGRPDCVAEDAVRGETVSRADLPAICNLQGDFQKLQGEPILCLSNLLMIPRCCKEFSRPKEQGALLGVAGRAFGYCREDFGNCREKSSWNC